METSTLKILRFDPGTMKEAALQEYRLPFRSGYTVMDALLYIYGQLDSSLAFRASCRAGLCMACLITIDGRAQCPCKTPLAEKMTLAPFKDKKVIRDLVVLLDGEGKS